MKPEQLLRTSSELRLKTLAEPRLINRKTLHAMKHANTVAWVLYEMDVELEYVLA